MGWNIVSKNYENLQMSLTK